MRPMRLRLPALSIGVLVVGHDLVYAIGHGTDRVAQALRDGGHEPYWAWVGVFALLATAGLISGAIVRWRSLRDRLARLGLGGHPLHRPAARDVLALWWRLLAVTLALFAVQENVEHYVAHAGHLPLLGVVTDVEYRAALPAFAAVSLLVAAVTVSIGAQITSLERALEGRHAWASDRSRPTLPRPVLALPRHRNSLATPDLGRGPPLASMT